MYKHNINNPLSIPVGCQSLSQKEWKERIQLKHQTRSLILNRISFTNTNMVVRRCKMRRRIICCSCDESLSYRAALLKIKQMIEHDTGNLHRITKLIKIVMRRKYHFNGAVESSVVDCTRELPSIIKDICEEEIWG